MACDYPSDTEGLDHTDFLLFRWIISTRGQFSICLTKFEQIAEASKASSLTKQEVSSDFEQQYIVHIHLERQGLISYTIERIYSICGLKALFLIDHTQSNTAY